MLHVNFYNSFKRTKFQEYSCYKQSKSKTFFGNYLLFYFCLFVLLPSHLLITSLSPGGMGFLTWNSVWIQRSGTALKFHQSLYMGVNAVLFLERVSYSQSDVQGHHSPATSMLRINHVNQKEQCSVKITIGFKSKMD